MEWESGFIDLWIGGYVNEKSYGCEEVLLSSLLIGSLLSVDIQMCVVLILHLLLSLLYPFLFVRVR